MPPAIEQALILAAGRGSRLRPVTDHTPKALVPFFGRPLIDYAAAHLVGVGVRRIAVNAHYLGDAIGTYVTQRLARRYPGVEWLVSEEACVLGTGGGIARLRSWLAGAPFWVVNADAVFAEPLAGLLSRHQRSGADATWMVTRDPVFAALRTVAVEAGRVVGITERARDEGVVFCGVHIAGPGLLETLPQGKRCCVVRHGYEPWMARGAVVQAVETAAFWADTGTPTRYVEAHRRGLEQVPLWRDQGVYQRDSA